MNLARTVRQRKVKPTSSSGSFKRFRWHISFPVLVCSHPLLLCVLITSASSSLLPELLLPTTEIRRNPGIYPKLSLLLIDKCDSILATNTMNLCGETGVSGLCRSRGIEGAVEVDGFEANDAVGLDVRR